MKTSLYTKGKPEGKTVNYYSPRSYRYISRYSSTRIISDEDGQHHETSDECVINYSDNDMYYTVDMTTENRIDIIATIHYGSPLNWWIIAKANNIIDPFNIPIGTTLRIPLIKSIYGSKGGL